MLSSKVHSRGTEVKVVCNESLVAGVPARLGILPLCDLIMLNLEKAVFSTVNVL